MTPVTLLTGASSGLGWALAPLLAGDGHAIALLARRLDKLEQLADSIRAAGGVALPIACDVADLASVREAVARCEDELGPVDRLVANAGMGASSSPRSFNSEQFGRLIQVNLMGVVHCIDAVLQGMLDRRHGHIVGVSSLAGYRGLPGASAYCASKAALNALLESLRIELEPHGIRVTTICPGFVKTAITERNTHPMPFLLDLEDGAHRMHRGIVRQRREFSFPWQLAIPVRMARVVPNVLYDWFLRGKGSPKRQDASPDRDGDPAEPDGRSEPHSG